MRATALTLALLAAPLAVALAATVGEDASDPVAALPEVVVVAVGSIIQPVVAEFLIEALEDADRSGAAAFVIELDTPGGLLTSTREIFTAMLAARTPTVVYVAPSGGQAASAGFFLLMAADVAVMAPGTNSGAAHPVGGQGEDIEGTMGEKVEQDAAATIRSLAARNGRDQKLAEAAVLESRSYSAEEALANGLADLVAPSLERLLAVLDGRQLADPERQELVLRTEGANMRRLEMSPFQRIRSTLVHPNIAYMLLTLGGLGLYFELANPGAVLPGVFGAICLILGFYGMSVLPVNYAGAALMALAGLLFFAEIKVQSFGVLTAGGLASLVLGSLMLFRSADPALRVSVQLVVALSVLALVAAVTLAALALRAQRERVTTGSAGMVTEHGLARRDFGPGTGKVDLRGEIWNAVSDAPIAAGDMVEVVEVRGLTLHVRPLAGAVPATTTELPEPRPTTASDDPAKVVT
ncbi:MAG TPA: nodulation protein NfeD [Thermoanaerobaculia bacterium]|nr:nodulation protein NfeD [Thermoanaerobaculia bacterium]